ncbi:MAG: hypothetical protein R2867_23135 [Caldilineaceae bacterium]
MNSLLPNHRRHRRLLFAWPLALLCVLAGCLPIQPISGGTIPNGTIPNGTIPSDQASAAIVLTWEGAPLSGEASCVHVTVDANGHAAFGTCGNVDQTATIDESHLQELDAMQRRFAPFTTETSAGTLTFTGHGTSANPAWQRAIAAWARLVYSELTSGTVSATGATVMSWVTGTIPAQPAICRRLTVLVYGYVYATTAPCAGGEVLSTTGGWLNDAELAQLDYWRTTYAPIYLEDNYLDGSGTAVADGAVERAIAAWAQLVYDEVSSGQVSATGATALSWFIDSPAGVGELCQHLTVLTFGYAYAEIVPCAGGMTVDTIGGSLTEDELTQLDRWLSTYTAVYVDNNYLAGTGTQTATGAEVAAIATWATERYARLRAQHAGGAMDLTTWASYTADSGFVIYYPPTLYGVEVLAGNSGSPFSGAVVFTPTEELNNQEPLAQTYKLTILAHVASKAYSLNDPAELLANGHYLSYAPNLLDGVTIQQTNLAGAPAVRVDNLPVGLAGTSMQLIAIRADIVYEVIVEPSQVSSRGDAADPANRALVAQMIDTFQFVR